MIWKKMWLPALLMGTGIIIGAILAKPSPVWNDASVLGKNINILDSRLQTPLTVGKLKIPSSQIEFETNFEKIGIFDDFEKEGDEYDRRADVVFSELAISQLIERKLFIQMIAQDSQFDATNPSLYTDCTDKAGKAIEEHQILASSSFYQEMTRERFCETDLIETYFNTRIVEDISVSKAEIDSIVGKSRNNAQGKFFVSFRQVLTATEAEAQQIKANINASNFSEMAKKKSIAAESENGGLIENLTRNQMPALFEVAFSLQTGQISEVVKTPYGYHILYLIKKGELQGVSGVDKAQVARELLAAKRIEGRKKWLSSALRTFDVRWGGSSGSAF